MAERNEPLLLEGRELHKSHGSGPSRIEVLKGVDISVRRGEMTAIVGASGSGKTTLLQILGTLDIPDSGKLLFEGRDLICADETALSRHRNLHIGFIFQFHHLLPEFSALENVMMPGLIAGQEKEGVRARATGLLEQVGLGQRLHHRSGELSGGEQQRVALARALVMEPDILLADEPTGNLDSLSGSLVFELLGHLSRSMGLAVLMVTHNMELAASMDRTLTLHDGILSISKKQES
ncbi:lipoprotein-releasing system ATP-binding protein LolD [Desulfolithobacter dissulfuricans]|uniref:Lipoprotein-releasing system ATP-binding protein LolD n=1 Tax=Desulfolithobacter dissulfuricans TaxID=2795293 RepID=A0A915U0F4_9BACT|nr:ABC transporter ATP-binding protein [Desulfolithobacter dissulfuricans]BCO08132.1 lipoprotein-releasing system ATP-binding protein LolD [Desulfolithobacter dissulfuricans]